MIKMLDTLAYSSETQLRSGKDLPRISIVTVVLNAVDTIEQTINSILQQSYPNLEFIVVDGGSSDGTLPLIERYQPRIDDFVSEPDQGISDAMNKGIGRATGDFLLFLHADDYLLDESALSRAAGCIMKDPKAEIHAFGIWYRRGSQSVPQWPRGFTPWMNFKTGIWHQATLCRKELFTRLGGFDINLKVVMDYDFFLRAYQEKCTTYRHSETISVMRNTGISSRRDAPSLIARFREERLVQQRYCRSRVLASLYAVYWPLYLRYRGFKEFGDMGILS